MIILKDKQGQLCNRLWAFSPFISESLEQESKIIILHFYDYYYFFENLSIYQNVKFLKDEKKLKPYKILFKILNNLPNKAFLKICILYGDNICISKLKLKHKLVILDGWRNKKPKKPLNLEKIQKLFRPKKKYTDEIDNLFFNKRKDFNLIIGVHIRRGDYKEFKGGKYYYSDEIIINYLSQLIKEFKQSKKITFLLCSNENIDTKFYKNSQFSIFQVQNTNLIKDLYALSNCDYIVGPPSTYSMWASFYGQKPLLFIKEPNYKIKRKEFSIVVSQNKFENGRVFTH